MASLAIIFGIVVGIPLIWYALTYNGLVAKRNQCRNAFSSIDVNLAKRHDLIPNIVAAVKGYMAHEHETLERLTALRSEARSLPPDSPARFAAEGGIADGLAHITMRAEAYPDLKTSENFLHLQRLLAEVEEQISAARRAFNAAVMDLNNSIEMFPSSLVANSMNLKRQEPFEALASSRTNVTVQL